MRRRVLAAGGAAAALLLSACGGSAHPAATTGPATTRPATGPGATGPGAMPGMPATPPPSTAPVAADHVTIKNFAFAPATIKVTAGTTVTWTNSDEDPHTVTSTTGAFRSPTLTNAATFRHTFTKPGTYPYLCTIHPFMRGTVEVTR